MLFIFLLFFRWRRYLQILKDILVLFDPIFKRGWVFLCYLFKISWVFRTHAWVSIGYHIIQLYSSFSLPFWKSKTNKSLNSCLSWNLNELNVFLSCNSSILFLKHSVSYLIRINSISFFIVRGSFFRNASISLSNILKSNRRERSIFFYRCIKLGTFL